MPSSCCTKRGRRELYREHNKSAVTKAADKIKEAIDRGLVTKEFADTLTHDDVPAKWRTTVEEKETERHFMKAFSRGGRKVLEVIWNKDWVGPTAKMFVATVYDDRNRVAKITSVANADALGARRQFFGGGSSTSGASAEKVAVH